mgnify:CR=1 FL=1
MTKRVLNEILLIKALNYISVRNYLVEANRWLSLDRVMEIERVFGGVKNEKLEATVKEVDD